MEWFEIHDIIRDVIELTKDDLVKWNSYDDNGFKTFYIDLGNGRIAISRQYESMDDEYDYDVQIFNGSGEMIENFFSAYENRENQFMLGELYEVAENSNLQRKTTINSIRAAISKLKSDNVF